MILKSKPGKGKYYNTLSQYMIKDCAKGKRGEPLILIRGINAKPTERRKIVKAFFDNAKPLKKRKNGNYLHHEIISLPKNLKISKPKQEEILYNLMQKYMDLRGDLHLAFGVVHMDKKHPHAHIMISSNEIGVKKNISSKLKFNRIRRELEHYQILNFPSVGTEYLYDKRRNKKKKKVVENKILIQNISQKNTKTQREINIDRIQEIVKKEIDTSYSLDELQTNLKKYNLEYYCSRGAYGIADLSLKAEGLSKSQYSFRIDKMEGVETSLCNLLEFEIEKNSREKELQKIRKSKPRQRKRSR